MNLAILILARTRNIRNCQDKTVCHTGEAGSLLSPMSSIIIKNSLWESCVQSLAITTKSWKNGQSGKKKKKHNSHSVVLLGWFSSDVISLSDGKRRPYKGSDTCTYREGSEPFKSPPSTFGRINAVSGERDLVAIVSKESDGCVKGSGVLYNKDAEGFLAVMVKMLLEITIFFP